MCTKDSTSKSLNCVICGAAFERKSKTGPVPKYCSTRCRNYTSDQRAKRAAREATKNKVHPTVVADCIDCGNQFSYVRKRKYRKRCFDCTASRKKLGRKNSCQNCGKPYIVRSTKHEYCSSKCSREAYKNTIVLDKCANCGDDFKRGRKSKLQYCSDLCRSAIRTSKHFSTSLVQHCKCIQCKRLFWSNGTERPLWCSVHCKSEYKASRSVFFSRYKYGKPPILFKICAETGHLFKPEKTLSQVYKDKKTARKVARRIKKDISDRIKPGAKLGRVDWALVLKRDNYKCQICGCDTPLELRGTYEPNAPEVDHIIPLSLGGDHTMDNVQCACRKCNGEKSDIHPDLYNEIKGIRGLGAK